MKTSRKAARDIVRQSYVDSFIKKLGEAPRGYGMTFEAGGKEYAITGWRLADWYILGQGTLDSMGKPVHDFVEREMKGRACGLHDYGWKGPVSLPVEVLAAAMAEKMLRSKEGKAQVGKTLESMLYADAEIMVEVKKGAARIAEESLSF